MHSVYNVVSGPLVWVSVIVFIGGSLYRLVSMAVLAKKKDGLIYTYMSLRYALRSILHWITPFGSENMRKHPVMTIVTFVFHISLFAAPLFLFAHISLIHESWEVSWWFMPNALADVLTLVVVGACFFFLVRRIVLPEVNYLTTLSDYIILLIVAMPFITGFWAYHQLPGVSLAGILHIISGEILLAVIPFTRLSHMLFFPFTRGYMGSEFGAIRHAKDW